jgi:hypothetical protein
MSKSNADYAVECAQQLSQHDLHRSTLIRMSMAIRDLQSQQRTWVGLDPEEIRKTNHHMVDGAYHYSFKQGAEWAEAKLKEKNT